MQQAMTFGTVRAGYPDAPAATHDDTSQAAARAIAPRAGSLRDRVLAAITDEPRTVHEVADLLGETVAAVQPRFSELRKMGHIEDGGDRRINEASGKRAIVWQPVCDRDAGLPPVYRQMMAREEKRREERRRATLQY